MSGRARTGASALLAAAGLAVSAYLAAHQLGLVGRVWDPVFGAASSAAVLGSALSGALPAPDALLGAAAYAAEVVLAVAVLAGAGRPAVLAYGALAAGMGLVGLGLVANAVAPGLLDRYLARSGLASQQTPQPADPDRPDDLFRPVDDGAHGGDRGAHGAFDRRAHQRSVQLWCSHHHGLLLGGLTAAAAGLVAAARRAA